MLYSVDSQSYIKKIPHEQDFRRWRSRISDQEYDAIVSELGRRISCDEIHTSSWIPGSDWAGTVFQPIYDKACLKNPTEAGKCFGLILWIVLLEDDDVWGFGRYEKNGVPIEGMTYFKLSIKP